ncbi:hypothetical protein BpHYR1_050944 [Brachionus plicatilis]|uniref:Uncharacterized protein n=1 Tax=Brachionus plicatilis TaxID=10195 RepID=A0A3M7QSK5_BRAPC|nr:hypothetical protein BpHYR1_050944 [Brachionus plicatilis]
MASRTFAIGAKMSLMANAISKMFKLVKIGSFFRTMMVIMFPIKPRKAIITNIMPHSIIWEKLNNLLQKPENRGNILARYTQFNKISENLQLQLSILKVKKKNINSYLTCDHYCYS